ncbi:hypothetical protein TRFO_32375 [Tritrichomonas foetus]|uniref:Transcriptional repressor Tup1 N-terminal domain-containing protein n=1 Tax=Tritrichomonas foetus TaxID=1144522 RepID=A0A1J4JNZ9_9EUKA|nr:hypothetical protein TRFO_32375 [Tritrichomonas foetus]|eukprot:OHT00857.1 hypothetical protein TRFO_32375 [Tritrichomonas foetus]
MNALSTDEIRGLFNTLSTEYERLNTVRSDLEAECAQLMDYIDGQVKQISSLSSDLEKLRKEVANSHHLSNMHPKPSLPPDYRSDYPNGPSNSNLTNPQLLLNNSHTGTKQAFNNQINPNSTYNFNSPSKNIYIQGQNISPSNISSSNINNNNLNHNNNSNSNGFNVLNSINNSSGQKTSQTNNLSTFYQNANTKNHSNNLITNEVNENITTTLSSSSNGDESIQNDYEITCLIPPEKIERSLNISLVAEILDVSVISSTGFSPDGKTLAIGSDRTLRVYDVARDDFLFQYTFQDGTDENTSNHLRSLAWAADGSRVFCGGEDHHVRVFSVPEGSLPASFEAGNGEVFQLQVSHDNSFLAAVTGDGTLSIWDMATLKNKQNLKRRKHSQNQVTTSTIPNNSNSCTTVDNSQTNISNERSNLKENELNETLRNAEEEDLKDIHESPTQNNQNENDNNNVNENKIENESKNENENKSENETKNENENKNENDNTNQQLNQEQKSENEDGKDFEEDEEEDDFNLNENENENCHENEKEDNNNSSDNEEDQENSGSGVATSLSISDDDKVIAVGYCDSYVGIWNLDNKSLSCHTQCHSSGVYSVKFYDKSTKLATSSLDYTVKLWSCLNDYSELHLLKVLNGHTNFVLSLAINPNEKWLLSGSKDLTAKLTDVQIPEMVYSIKAHTNSVITVSFSNDGTMFCTGSGDKSVRIWSIQYENE